ncbi:MAG: glucose-1-phosphate cytidylyltransferase [Crocinitomicaceae bacterium]
MKVVILAGGLGTRLMEETGLRPKPMVEIGGRPILWHIMKIYQRYGYSEFIICLGYRAEMIKKYFLDYQLLNSNFTINTLSNEIEVISPSIDNFKVTLVDTGELTNTAGRISRIREYVKNEQFMLTYGDGVADIDINKLLRHHNESGKIATLTAIQLPGRFGGLVIDKNDEVSDFNEKPTGDGHWVNGGFFVLNPEVFDYLDGDLDNVQWEKGPLVSITNSNQLSAYRHNGFWKPMDALRDKIELEELWRCEKAPWKNW